jgi:hypothetical protein
VPEGMCWALPPPLASMSSTETSKSLDSGLMGARKYVEDEAGSTEARTLPGGSGVVFRLRGGPPAFDPGFGLPLLPTDGMLAVLQASRREDCGVLGAGGRAASHRTRLGDDG